MIGFILALFLGVQGAPATQQPGVVTGQIQMKDGTRPTGVRISAIAVPAGNMGPEAGPNYFNAGPPAAIGLTDAQGRFRLEPVPAGRYYILGGTIEQPSYYSANGEGSQTPQDIVTVGGGQTVQDINFSLLIDPGRIVSGKFDLGKTPILPAQPAILNGSKVGDYLQTPVSADGTFEFGRVPPGTYMLTTIPMPPGLLPTAVTVGKTDVKGLVVAAPVTRNVTGRIVMTNGGPIPMGILGFYNVQSYVGTTVNPDGTFTAQLHPAQHKADVAGLPVGYRLYSVRIGTNDVTKGFKVDNSDISGATITVSGPTTLPRVRGKVNGLPIERTTAAKVELTGPIFGTLQASLASDGSFEIPKAVPGLYKVRILQVPEFVPVELVITSKPVTEVQLTVTVKK